MSRTRRATKILKYGEDGKSDPTPAFGKTRTLDRHIEYARQMEAKARRKRISDPAPSVSILLARTNS